MSTSQNSGSGSSTEFHWRPLNEPGSGGLVSSVSFSPNNPNHMLVGGDMLGVGLSTDGGQSWQRPKGFTTVYEIEEFTWHPTQPNVVWAATREGPYLSRDGGQTWEKKRQGMPREYAKGALNTSPIQKILYGPQGQLLAFGGNHREFGGASAAKNTDNYGAVWQSFDNGESWSIRGRINPGDSDHNYNIKAVTYAGSSQTLYAAVESKGVYRSQDLGATWQLVSGGRFSDANDITAHPNDPGTLWVSTDTGLYKTQNGGNSWSAINSGISNSHVRGDWEVIEVAPSNPNVLMAANYRKQAIYRSENGGASWQQLKDGAATALGGGLSPRSLSFDPNNADRVIMGTMASVYVSEDRGRSWTDATSEVADAGANEWRGRGYSGWASRNFEWNPYRPSQATFQAMDEGGLWLSDDLDGWRTLRQQSNGASNGIGRYGGGWDVAFVADGKTLYTTLHQQYPDGNPAPRGIAKSTDGGNTWNYLSRQPGGVANKTAHAYEIHVLPDNPNYLWVRVDNQLWSSSNGGNSWSQVKLDGAQVLDLAAPTDRVSNPADALLYVATKSGVYRLQDNRWTALGGPGSGQRVDLEIDPQDSSRIYLANWNARSDRGLHRFENGRWEQISEERHISDVAVSPVDSNLLVATTLQDPYKMTNSAPGVMVSRDRGKTWQLNNQGLGVVRAQVVEFSPDGQQIVVGSGGGGFFVADLNADFSPVAPAPDAGDFAPLQPDPVVPSAPPAVPVSPTPATPVSPPVLPPVSSPTSPSPNPSNPSAPSPARVRVEMEDYVDFQDSTAQNYGRAYRSDAVDLEASGDVGGGYSLGWISQGEWLSYDVDVPTTGEYRLVARGASFVNQPHRFQATMNGQSIDLAVSGTGGWKNWQDFTSAETLSLTAGQNNLRLDMLSNNFNLNYIELQQVEPASGSAPVAPAPQPTAPPSSTGGEVPRAMRVELEDYTAFQDSTSGNYGRVYRNDSVDLISSGDVGGGYALGWISRGEWLTYDLDVAVAGEYRVVARGASNLSGERRFQASVGDDVVDIAVTGTGGWNTWQDFAATETLSLAAGQNELRLEMQSNHFNLNYLDLIPVSSTSAAAQMVDVTAVEQNLGSSTPASGAGLAQGLGAEQTDAVAITSAGDLG